MKTLFRLVILAAIGFGVYWWWTHGRPENLNDARDAAARQAQQMGEAVKDKIKDLAPSSADIKEELERTGKVVRKKAQQAGAVISDATADARLTATIKAKLLKDTHLAALGFSVNTTDGVVTLSGRAESADQVSQAMKIALETEGVREVISTLQVKGASDAKATTNQ
jgi:osmotically-inducible protein OsmY